MTGENWIDDVFSEVTSDVETPDSWIWWSLVTAVSAVAANNYFVRAYKGNVIYKPNLYIMFLADSGVGKSYPINLAKKLVMATDSTRVIAGRSSIQAIVQELATTSSRNGKPPIQDSRAFIVNGELSSAIIADVDALAILTDLYDGNVHEEWTNRLKGDGKEKLKDPYITAIFGSSPAHFYDSIPQANIEGGYIGRNLVVYEQVRAREIDALDSDDSLIDNKINEYIVPKYSPHLIEIATHKGRLIPSPSAKEYYNSWKHQWRKEQKPEKTGFINRVPDHVLKVAMCICLARYSNGGVISDLDISDAIERVTKLIYANKITVEGHSLDPLANQTKVVLDILLRADDFQLHRKMLLSRMYNSGNGCDAVVLDRIIENLNEMGWCKKERFVAGKATDWIIHLSGEPLENYKKYLLNQSHKRSGV